MSVLTQDYASTSVETQKGVINARVLEALVYTAVAGRALVSLLFTIYIDFVLFTLRNIVSYYYSVV